MADRRRASAIPSRRDFLRRPGPASARSRRPGCSSRTGRAPGTAPAATRPAALPPQGDAGHLPLHARRPEPPGDVRSQARPAAPLRPALAGQLRPGGDAPAGGGEPAPRHPSDVPPRRPERPADLRLPAASRRLRRRAGGDPVLQGGQRQSSPGRLPDEHRLDPDGQAEPGELGRLRPGHGEPGPARVRGPARPGRRHQGRPAGLRCRLPAGELPGDRHAVGSPADPRPRAAGGDDRRRAAADPRPDRPPERPPPRRAGRRLRALGAHPGVRAGLPDAVGRPRGRRPVGRDRGDPPTLRARPARDGRVRHPLPAGPPAGRARRPVRAALLGRRERLGRPRRRRGQPRADVRPDRPARRAGC